jgi:hypothetical protein
MALGLTLVLPLAAYAQSPIRFANVVWGATKAETKQKLVSAGFTFVKEDKDGDLQFSGSMPILGEPAVIFAFFTPGDKLVKYQVNIAPPDHRSLAVYRSVKLSLTEKYGKPSTDMEHYSYPYDDDGGAVGHETTAIRNGKAVIASIWGRDELGTGLVLSVTDKLLDQLDYESADWSAELARRKKRASVY